VQLIQHRAQNIPRFGVILVRNTIVKEAATQVDSIGKDLDQPMISRVRPIDEVTP